MDEGSDFQCCTKQRQRRRTIWHEVSSSSSVDWLLRTNDIGSCYETQQIQTETRRVSILANSKLRNSCFCDAKVDDACVCVFVQKVGVEFCVRIG